MPTRTYARPVVASGGLPRAIWMSGPTPSVYAGTPVEMVRAMAKEMDPALLPKEAIQILCVALRYTRDVRIRLTWTASEEKLSEQFIRGLLGCGVGRVVPDA